MLKMTGNGAEAERVGVAPRPREQHVERVGEEQLRHDEMRGVVDLPPVPAPVQQHRPLRAGLEVVLFAEHDFESQMHSAAGGGYVQAGKPREQDTGCAPERP